MDAKDIKMRVLYSSDKAKMQTFANALGEAFKCPFDAVPPGFPCEKERLVVIGLTLKGEPNDKLRLFCRELTAQRAQNVALFIDGEKKEEDSKALKIVKEMLREAGTNVIDNDYYVKGGGLFSKKISLDERTQIVRWVQGIIDNLKI